MLEDAAFFGKGKTMAAAIVKMAVAGGIGESFETMCHSTKCLVPEIDSVKKGLCHKRRVLFKREY